MIAWVLVCTVVAAGRGQPQPGWAALEHRHLRNIRQVTFDGQQGRAFLRAGEGYFSPDGRIIIFQAVRGRNPFYQIFTMQLDGGPPHLVSTGRGRTTCPFFRPDGRKVIFASSHLDPQVEQTEAAERRRLAAQSQSHRGRYRWVFDPYMDIFEADPDGSNLRRLTTAHGYDAECSYSPDGKQIVFCSTRDGDPDLYIMNADGSGVRQLTDAPGYDGGPFFSPDGRRVIFRSDRKHKDLLQLYIIDADGRHERALTDNRGVNWGPYWHPDGRHIIYSFADYSNRAVRPNFDLYLMDLETGQSERITYSTAADVLPAFSPDGRRLMWTSKRRRGTRDSQLFIADFIMEPAGGKARSR